MPQSCRAQSSPWGQLEPLVVARLTRNRVCFPDIRLFVYDKGHAS
jgi:hypothetical protein